MGFWDNLFGKKSTPDRVREDLEHFMACVSANKAAKCCVRIPEFHETYWRIADQVRDSSWKGDARIIDIMWRSLSSICPRCKCVTDGENLGQIDMAANLGVDRVTFIGPGRAVRFLKEGLCLNLKCSSRKIILCWQPN